MNIEDVSPELLEKASRCTSAEELLALAREEVLELTEDQLNTASAGGYLHVCETYPDPMKMQGDSCMMYISMFKKGAHKEDPHA